MITVEYTDSELLQMIVDNTDVLNNIASDVSQLISKATDILDYLSNYNDLVVMARVAFVLIIVYIIRRIAKGV